MVDLSVEVHAALSGDHTLPLSPQIGATWASQQRDRHGAGARIPGPPAPMARNDHGRTEVKVQLFL